MSLARNLYFQTAERIMGIARRKEHEVVEIIARYASPSITCEFLKWLVDRLPGSSVCVLGPLYDGRNLEDCEIVAGVEQTLKEAARLDLLVGDLDSLASQVLDPTMSTRFWLIHVHSDNLNVIFNMSVLNKIQLNKNIVFTSQAVCLWPVLGVGGFTDGDRVLILSMALGARQILTYGFNLERVSCSSKIVCDIALKRRKLEIAKYIIEETARKLGYNLEYLSNKDQTNILLHRT